MSNASLTSSKFEKNSSDLVQEVESIKCLNSSLRSYLDHLRTFKKNLVSMNDNCQELSKVNKQWIEVINNMK